MGCTSHPDRLQDSEVSADGLCRTSTAVQPGWRKDGGPALPAAHPAKSASYSSSARSSSTWSSTGRSPRPHPCAQQGAGLRSGSGSSGAIGSWPCQPWARCAPVPAAEGAQSRYLYQSLNCFNYPHLSHPQLCFIKARSPADKSPFVLLQSLSTGNCQVPINQQLLLQRCRGEMR